MRYRQYLNETINDKVTLQIGVEVVYKHCMPFIKDLISGGFDYLQKNDDLLYSGRNKNKNVFVQHTRTNRKPVDMDYDLYLIYDKLFYKKFGIKGRSNAIFCSGDISVVSSYGAPYIIFPAGKYKFLWSDQIKDLYMDKYSSITIDLIINEYQQYRRHKLRLLTNKSDIIKFVKEYPVDFYSAPDTNKFKIDFYKKLNKKVIDTYYTSNIMTAIKSGHEIMIKCSYYVGLNYMDYNRVIKQYIDQNGTTYPSKEFFYEWYEKYIG